MRNQRGWSPKFINLQRLSFLQVLVLHPLLPFHTLQTSSIFDCHIYHHNYIEIKKTEKKKPPISRTILIQQYVNLNDTTMSRIKVDERKSIPEPYIHVFDFVFHVWCVLDFLFFYPTLQKTKRSLVKRLKK